MKKLETRKFEMINCECGHCVPIDFARINKSVTAICKNCIIDDLKMKLKFLRKNKTTELPKSSFWNFWNFLNFSTKKPSK